MVIEVGVSVRGRDLGKTGSQASKLYTGVRCPDCREGENLRLMENQNVKGREEVRCSIHSAKNTAARASRPGGWNTLFGKATTEQPGG